MKHTINLESFVTKVGRQYFEKNGFTEVTTPRLVRASGACENINTLFEVSVDNDQKWFNGKRAYLAQTGQLYLEALVPEMGNVFAVGPSFRAEPKVDNRHLVEFQMLEIEFPGGFEKLLIYIEGYIKAIAATVTGDKKYAQTALGLTEKKIRELNALPKKLPRVTYDKAINILKSLGEKIEWGDDIDSAREEKLVHHFGGYPLFITHYPDPMWKFEKPIEVEKFFNMLPDGKGRVFSSDLILPGAGEAVGSAARVHQLAVLKKRLIHSRMFRRLREHGGSLSDFQWYINQVKKHGAVPHAGCGFGISRILKWLRGTPDIRKAVAFPVNRKILI